MEEIGNILPKAFKNQLLCRKPRALEVLGPLWARVVGRLIAQHSRPTAFSEGTLTVSAFSLPWAAQLSQMAEQIRAEINGFLAGPVVRKVRVRCQPYSKPDARAAAAPAKSDRAQLLACSDEKLSRLLWADGRTKLDPEIAGVVERSFVKYFSRNGRGLDACL